MNAVSRSHGQSPGYGALVISLDFEIHWGVRDHTPVDGPYRQNLLGVRHSVMETLALFREFGIHGTWATVGFLFAGNRADLDAFRPSQLPTYENARLYPYDESVGEGEVDDPFHYARGIVEQIKAAHGQELATHTYSHYYCEEPGQTADQFNADLGSARRIAAARGVELNAIVFPRNQHNPAYDPVLLANGITVYRGRARSWIYGATSRLEPVARAGRLLDSYVDVRRATVPWSAVPQPGGLSNVAASIFVRPVSREPQLLRSMRAARISRLIRRAARSNEIVHLWWHPHNFGVQTSENMAFLRAILSVYHECSSEHGMRSLTMSEAAGVASRTARAREMRSSE